MYLELSLWLTSTTHINAIHIPDFFQKKTLPEHLLMYNSDSPCRDFGFMLVSLNTTGRQTY